MAFSYTNLKNYVQLKCENKQDNVSPSLRTALNEAIRDEITSFDYRSLQRHTRTLRAMYDNVYLYPLPSDMMDEALVSIQKYKHFDEPSNVNYRKVSLRKFNSNKNENTFAFDYDHGVKWLTANFGTTKSQKVLHKLDNLTDNGTWTATDDGSAIVLNAENHISGNFAIQITNTGTANSITNSTLSQVGISDTTRVFTWVYLPDADNVSNVTILYGSDASNYFSSNATTPYNTTSFRTGWNLVGVPRSSEASTGSPDEDKIDYAKITVNYSSASTDDIVFDQLWATRGDGYDLVYSSFYPWRTSAGSWQETSAADSDLLNVDIDEWNVIKKKCAFEIATQAGVSDTAVARLHQEYMSQKVNYQRKYPSQRKKIRSFY